MSRGVLVSFVGVLVGLAMVVVLAGTPQQQRQLKTAVYTVGGIIRTGLNAEHLLSGVRGR